MCFISPHKTLNKPFVTCWWVLICSQRMLLFLFSLSVKLSHVWLFATLWTVAHQAPLSMGFFRQEYWSGLPFPPLRDLPKPGIEPAFLIFLSCSQILYHWATREAIPFSITNCKFSFQIQLSQKQLTKQLRSVWKERQVTPRFIKTYIDTKHFSLGKIENSQFQLWTGVRVRKKVLGEKMYDRLGFMCSLEWYSKMILHEGLFLCVCNQLDLGKGFPDGPGGKEPASQCRRHKRCMLDPWVGKIPWKKTWQPTPVFLLEESHGQRSLVGIGSQSQTWLKWLSTQETWEKLHNAPHAYRFLRHTGTSKIPEIKKLFTLLS